MRKIDAVMANKVRSRFVSSGEKQIEKWRLINNACPSDYGLKEHPKCPHLYSCCCWKKECWNEEVSHETPINSNVATKAVDDGKTS